MTAKSSTARAFLASALIVLFVLLLLPALNAPYSRRRNPCINHIRSLSLAIANYEVENGRYPPTYIADAAGRPLHSWRILILPFLDDPLANEIYDQYRFDEPWNGPNNRRLAKEMPRVFRCPDEVSDQPWHTSYVAIVGADTIWSSEQGRHIHDIKDGTSKTLLLVEQPMSGIHWMEPRDLNLEELAILDPDGPRNHGGSVIIGSFADGHTLALSSIGPERLRRLATIAGGEEISPDEL